MRNDLIASILLLLFIASAVSGSWQVHASSQGIPIELGYGLSSLSPVSAGVPVYTVGDTMWIASTYNATVSVSLFAPNSTLALRTSTLETKVPVPLHSFSSIDREGLWSIRLSIPETTQFNLQVHFINTDYHKPMVSLTQSDLRNERLLVGFQVTSVDTYDEESCLASEQVMNEARISLPQSVGAGLVGIRREGENLFLETNASITSPFTFWFELYHPYSYNVMNSVEFISKSVRSADSEPLVINSSGRSNTTLSWETSPRIGRYELRAFFQNQQGLFVTQSRLLLGDQQSWLSLDSCQLSPVSSTSVAFLASLQGNPDSWPSTLFLMYRVFGVESVSVLPLTINLSKVVVLAAPWQIPVDDLKVQDASNPRTEQLASENGTIYLIAKSYPVILNYSIGSGGGHVGAGQVIIWGGYIVQKSWITLAKLSVHVLGQEAPSAGVQVRVSNGANHTITKSTNINAYATFFVPSGHYNVTATLGNLSRSAQVTLQSGNETILNMDLQGTGAFLIQPEASLETILIVTGIVGVAVNVVVWIIRPRILR